MSVAATYAPNRYHRVQMNTVSLNNAHTKALVGASLKGYSLHCIIFRTATDKTTPRLIQFHTLKNAVNPPFLGGFLISGTVAA